MISDKEKHRYIIDISVLIKYKFIQLYILLITTNKMLSCLLIIYCFSLLKKLMFIIFKNKLEAIKKRWIFWEREGEIFIIDRMMKYITRCNYYENYYSDFNRKGCNKTVIISLWRFTKHRIDIRYKIKPNFYFPNFQTLLSWPGISHAYTFAHKTAANILHLTLSERSSSMMLSALTSRLITRGKYSISR